MKIRRQEQGISQKKLEELSGVKQPVIARMEKGSVTPRIGTVVKVLASLGRSSRSCRSTGTKARKGAGVRAFSTHLSSTPSASGA
ncbi:MAG: helix-turn-helix domain-containing protein [Synergistaceae bacterium]|nr:helix-turn-helix domain-containing protein [Synergistaceae bacterium]